MKKVMRSVAFACKGILKAYTLERNLKIMAAISLLTFLLSYALSLSRNQFYVILLCNAVAHGVELLNTSIEYLCNHIHVGYHKDIEMVKDIAAGATLVVSIMCGVIGVLIFVQAVFPLHA